jgi:hypothetical protein
VIGELSNALISLRLVETRQLLWTGIYIIVIAPIMAEKEKMKTRLVLAMALAFGSVGSLRADDESQAKLKTYRGYGVIAGVILYAQGHCKDKIKGIGTDHERDTLAWLSAKRDQSLAEAKAYPKAAEAALTNIKPDDYTTPFDYTKAMDVARSKLDGDKNFASQLATAFDLNSDDAERNTYSWPGYRDEFEPCDYIAKALPQLYSLK